MQQQITVKDKSLGFDPNLKDYHQVYQTFDYDEVAKELTWFDNGQLNAAYNAIDRHARTALKNKVCLYWEGGDGSEMKYTFAELASLSNRFANLLHRLKVKKGDRVFFFLPRIPELFIGFLGTLKRGAVAGTLFSAFGPQALEDRLKNSNAKILVTTPELKPRVDAVRSRLPRLEKIILVDQDQRRRFSEEAKIDKKNKSHFYPLLAQVSDNYQARPMNPDDPAFMLYTSGTTGKPKGVVHVHRAILHEHLTAKYILDIKDEDVYWCVPPDSVIITNPRPRKISDLKVGDKVLTHNGEFRPIKRLYRRPFEGQLIKIKTRYSNIPMYLTPNHQILSGQRGKKAISWLPAGEITKDDYVLFPRVRKRKDRDYICIDEVVKGCFVKSGIVQRKKLLKKLKNRVKVDGRFTRLAGYYLGEGSLGAKNRVVQFSFKKTEENWADDVTNLLEVVFSMDSKKLFINNLVEVRANSAILAEFFAGLFGRKSCQKRVPQWFLYLPDEKLEEFLKGFWRGDGDTDRDRFRFCTTSEELAYQLKLIFYKLGLVCTFQAKHNRYYLTIGGKSLEMLSQILDKEHPFLKKRSGTYQYARITPNFVWLPIGSVRKEKYKGTVMNLETEVGSYTLNNMAVHNCTADPGWVTGIAYEMLGNWSNGAATLVYEGRFDPDKWYSLIQEYRVTVWYTAPTAIRMLMAADDQILKKYHLGSLRHLVSVGEPLNPEAVWWSHQKLGHPFHDTWWQTETGGILIANYPAMTIKPGSMGKPVPGITVAIIDDNGLPLPPLREGNLAIKPGWPSMMKTIFKRPQKYQSYFVNDWYLSGDRAYQDKDGYFWFIGRADDVIKTAGERVGPFEVESALLEHPAVAEAGVIGKPDPLRGEIIKAFIALKRGYQPSEDLKNQIANYVKKNLAGHAYPREIEFRDKLPKTRSGKIMRRILKAQELGLPIGDTSTLEEY